MAEMVFRLGADVNDALRAMTAVEQRTVVLQNRIQSLQGVIGQTNSVQKLNQAMNLLAETKKQLSQITTATGQTISNKLIPATNQAGTAVNNLSRVVQDAPFGFIAISNNLQPLFDNFTQLRTQTGSVGGAFKALGGSLVGPAGISLAFAAATALITVFSKEIFGSGEAAKKAKADTDKLKESINSIYAESAKEASGASALIAILKNETETRERKLSAIKQLQQIQPEVFAGLKLEGNAIVGLDAAYKNYIENLKTVIAAKIKQAQLDQALEKLLKLQGVTLTAQERQNQNIAETIGQITQNQLKGSVAGVQFSNRQTQAANKQKDAIVALQDEINNLNNDLIQLSKGVKVPPIRANVSTNRTKTQKDIQRDLNRLQLEFKIENPVLKALQSPNILPESERIGLLISESIAKNIKPLPSLVNPQIQQQLNEQKKTLQEQLQFAQGAANIISNSFSQAFNSILQGKNVFKSLGESIKALVLELVQAVIKALIFRAVINAIVPGGAAAIGATGIGNLLGFRANGGPVSGRSPYIVGERGPELFVPSVSGSIIPNNQLSSFNGRPAFAGAMGGRSIVRGNDIILSYARTQRSQSRVNG